MNPDTGHRILLFHGRGLISALIRWQTRGKYSHAAILCPSGVVLESWQGVGVRQTYLRAGNGVTRFKVPGATPEQWQHVEQFIRDRIGKGYDYWAIARFISRRHMPDNDRWFCSEIILDGFEDAGYPLLARLEPSEGSPTMLSYSPYLVEENHA